MKISYYIITIVSFILILYCLNCKRNKLASKCWIDTSLYPEAKYIFENKNTIKNELIQILNSNKWGKWLSYNEKAPSFSKMSEKEIMNKINNSYGKINESDDGSWRLYGLILNKKALETSKKCPETMKILNKVSKRILNAGFSLLEPGSITEAHVGHDNKFYRLHIPLIIPKNNQNLKNTILDKSCNNKELAVFQVEDDYRAWKEDDYFIFNDLCLHNAWNKTNENRIVLLVDLLRE
jgi:aspartyl/asparaginyl beta-hydroxylase (cupin superfamily)